MPEIWKRTKNVVPLHCQSEDRRALKMRDTRRDSATRCSWPQVNLILCKNTFLSTMAKILYEVKPNNNRKSDFYGKWYARVKTLETLNTRGMANHIAEHGSVFTSDVVFGVLEKFRSCLIEQLLNSKKVKIDGGGADSKEKFSVLENIKALHIRFLPEQEQEMNISSRQFIKRAKFISIDQLKPDPEEEHEPEPEP